MHNHTHGGGHSHSHDDHHHHHHHKETPMSFEEQLKTLFAHWVSHNDSHAGTYRDWAAKAKENGLAETAAVLEEIAAMTEEVSDKIRDAEKTVK